MSREGDMIRCARDEGYERGYEQGMKDAENHGWWRSKEHFMPFWKCQACGFEMPIIERDGIESSTCPCCPWCGAKMDAQEGAEHE